jgi:DNA topoisomerase-1
LVENFKNILDYDFTASVELEFDHIADGALQWNEMIKRFYSPFHATVETATAEAKRATGERELGIDPATEKPVFAKIGRFGPMIQIGLGEDDDKKFASLRGTQSIGSISLEEALELFKLPRDVGQFEEEVVVVGIGRYGPYVRHKNKFVSLDTDAGDDPNTIELSRAIKLIEDKRQEVAKSIIKTFEEDETISVLKGRYGPYIKAGKKNVRIPKDKEPADLTFEEVKELVEAAAKKPARGKRK